MRVFWALVVRGKRHRKSSIALAVIAGLLAVSGVINAVSAKKAASPAIVTPAVSVTTSPTASPAPTQSPTPTPAPATKAPNSNAAPVAAYTAPAPSYPPAVNAMCPTDQGPIYGTWCQHSANGPDNPGYVPPAPVDSTAIEYCGNPTPCGAAGTAPSTSQPPTATAKPSAADCQQFLNAVRGLNRQPTSGEIQYLYIECGISYP
jgi:hypothetical protein